MIFIAVWLQQEDITKEVFCCQATFSLVLQLERNRFPCAFLFVSVSGSKLEGVKRTIEKTWEATGNQGTYCYVPPCILKSECSLPSFYLTETSYGCSLYYVFQVYEEGQRRNSIVPNHQNWKLPPTVKFRFLLQQQPSLRTKICISFLLLHTNYHKLSGLKEH